jgi:hypothetical protein
VQLPDFCQFFSSAAICQEAIMPYFDKSIGQGMEQETSDKLNRIDSGLLDLFGFTILVCKGYLSLLKADQPMIGYGNR